MTEAPDQVLEDRVRDRAATGLPAGGGADFVVRLRRIAKLGGPLVLDASRLPV